MYQIRTKTLILREKSRFGILKYHVYMIYFVLLNSFFLKNVKILVRNN